jgi:CRISPR-associated protein (TIGR02710 family)
MQGEKALLISIGTGISPSEQAVDSLAHGILFSIQNTHPDMIFFVVSKDSERVTLPKILPQISLPFEILRIDDPEDIQKIYDDLSPKFQEIRNRFSYLVVDFTSGTKAMTGSLAVLSTLFDADVLSYISGKRKGGIVQPGTETLHSVRPYFATLEKRRLTAIKLFNECRFDATLALLQEIESYTADPDLLSRVAPLRRAALAYSAWDKFEHQQAFEHLKEVNMESFNPNKAFLGKLLHQESKEPFYLVDIISNARRRGEVERKYDDAVARLYRAMELIAQYRLQHYGITDTGDIPQEKIPLELREKWRITSGEKVKLGLVKAYELLASYDDKLGKTFQTDEQLRDLLSKRNSSILAHGLLPVEQDTFEKLRDKVESYASMVVNRFSQLLKEASFRQWEEGNYARAVSGRAGGDPEKRE